MAAWMFQPPSSRSTCSFWMDETRLNPSSEAGSKHRAETPEGLPPRWTKPIEWWVTRRLIGALFLLGRSGPRTALTPLGRWLGRLAFRVMRRYREVAFSNLRRVHSGAWDAARID